MCFVTTPMDASRTIVCGKTDPAKLVVAQVARHMIATVVLLNMYGAFRALLGVCLEVLPRSSLMFLVCTGLLSHTKLIVSAGLSLVHDDFAEDAVSTLAELTTKDVAVGRRGVNISIAAGGRGTHPEERILLHELETSLVRISSYQSSQ